MASNDLKAKGFTDEVDIMDVIVPFSDKAIKAKKEYIQKRYPRLSKILDVMKREIVELHLRYLATIAADRKTIEGLKKRPEEIYEGELEAARKHLCEAAEEINCSGTIKHRIRILKKELGQKIADQAATIERLRGLVDRAYNIATYPGSYSWDMWIVEARQAIEKEK